MTNRRGERITGWLQWGRSDQLGLEAVVYLAVGLGALSALPRLVGGVRGEPIPLRTQLPEALVRPTAGVEGPLSGTVVLTDPSAAHHLLGLVPSVLAVVLALVGARLLLHVVRSLGDGDPFTPGNARRLRLIALLLAIGGPLVQVVGDLTRNALLSQVSVAADLPVEFNLSLWPLAAGLLVAFVAEVFARGSALRAEVEGLV